MKRIVVVALVMLVCSGWAISGQQSEGVKISVQGGGLGRTSNKDSDQARQLLTNESVVKLVKAKLGEDIIVSMVNNQPGRYSTGADEIIALKNVGVSEKIINAMLTSTDTSAKPVLAARTDASLQMNIPDGPGLYALAPTGDLRMSRPPWE